MDPARMLSDLLDAGPDARHSRSAASNEADGWADSRWREPDAAAAAAASPVAGNDNQLLLPVAVNAWSAGDAGAEPSGWVAAVLDQPARWISALLVVSALCLAASVWWRDHRGRDGAAGAPGAMAAAAAPGGTRASAEPNPSAAIQPPVAVAAVAPAVSAEPPHRADDAVPAVESPEEASAPGACSRAAAALALCAFESAPTP
jgi:hypothetical protein